MDRNLLVGFYLLEHFGLYLFVAALYLDYSYFIVLTIVLRRSSFD